MKNYIYCIFQYTKLYNNIAQMDYVFEGLAEQCAVHAAKIASNKDAIAEIMQQHGKFEERIKNMENYHRLLVEHEKLIAALKTVETYLANNKRWQRDMEYQTNKTYASELVEKINRNQSENAAVLGTIDNDDKIHLDTSFNRSWHINKLNSQAMALMANVNKLTENSKKCEESIAKLNNYVDILKKFETWFSAMASNKNVDPLSTFDFSDMTYPDIIAMLGDAYNTWAYGEYMDLGARISFFHFRGHDCRCIMRYGCECDCGTDNFSQVDQIEYNDVASFLEDRASLPTQVVKDDEDDEAEEDEADEVEEDEDGDDVPIIEARDVLIIGNVTSFGNNDSHNRKAGSEYRQHCTYNNSEECVCPRCQYDRTGYDY